MKIRKATKKDLNNIYLIFLELAKSEEKNSRKAANFFKKLNRRKNNFEKSSKKELLKDINGKNSILFVAEENNKLLGYISGNFVSSKNPFYKQVILGYLIHIIVSKEYRGKGISKRLYKKLEEWFMKKKCKFIYLEVFSTNSAVKKFKKSKYKIVSHKMWKELK